MCPEITIGSAKHASVTSHGQAGRHVTRRTTCASAGHSGGENSRMPLLPELFLVKGDLLAAADHPTGDGPAPWYQRAAESASVLDSTQMI